MQDEIKIKGLFHFRGLILTVLEHEDSEYLPAQPLSDLLGMLWKSTKRSLFHGDNAELYGSRVLRVPAINNSGTTSGARDAVCIELRQVYLFLARTNTNQLRTKGNATGADYLLALQREWGEALYSYETFGSAHKRAQDGRLGQLMALFKSRNATSNPQEQTAITALIRQQFAELGQPVPEDADLFATKG